jgi:hypothetical protein
MHFYSTQGNTMKKTAEQKNKSLVLEASTRDMYPGSTVRIRPDGLWNVMSGVLLIMGRPEVIRLRSFHEKAG